MNENNSDEKDQTDKPKTQEQNNDHILENVFDWTPIYNVHEDELRHYFGS